MTTGPVSRRQLLFGRANTDSPRAFHISSAVVRAIPSKVPGLLPQLTAMPGVQVAAQKDGRIVLVIEGSGAGELGERLIAINLLDGVIAASMVFEHFEQEGERHDHGTDAP